MRAQNYILAELTDPQPEWPSGASPGFLNAARGALNTITYYFLLKPIKPILAVISSDIALLAGNDRFND